MHDKSHKIAGRYIQAAVALCVLFAVSQSYAACDQIDLKGTWFLNGVTGVPASLQFVETNFCKVIIGSAGKVKDGSQCKFRDDVGVSTIALQGGKLTLSSFCKITGYLEACDGDLCDRVRIDDARLDAEKTVITMVGRTAFDAGVFFVTGVKR